MPIRPLFDRVLLKRSEAPTHKSGLFIHTSEKPTEGVVLAVGTGRVSEDGTVTPLLVKVGDRVAFTKYAGTEIEVENAELLLLREADILGVIE
jgi:chaperonin GroES